MTFERTFASLGSLMVAAPLCALERTRERCHIVHVVTLEEMVRCWSCDAAPHSPCGATVGVLDVPLGSGDVVPWPVSTRGLPTPLTRCRECWELTGRKRPRSRLARKVEA